MTVRKARRKNARIQLEDKRGAVFAYPNVLGKRFTRQEGFGCLCIRDEAKQIRASFQDMETIVIKRKIYAHPTVYEKNEKQSTYNVRVVL